MKRFLILLCLPPVVAMAQVPAEITGEWRGQVQYQATIDRKLDSAAHAVTALTIRVEPGGKVWGTSKENGCKLLGIAAPQAGSATVMRLDVTLSDCQYAGLNRRYQGHIANYKSHVDLLLMAQDIGLGRRPGVFDVKGTLRR